MKQAIVVFNSGSTSLKFGAYGVDAAAGPAASLSLLRVGRIDSMQGRSALCRQGRRRQSAEHA